MSPKERNEARRTARRKGRRLAVEIAPGVRTRLEAYLQERNEDPGRVTPPLAYTDVINRAIDRFFQEREPLLEVP